MLSYSAVRASATLNLLLNRRAFQTFAPIGRNKNRIQSVATNLKRASDGRVQQVPLGALSFAHQAVVDAASLKAAFRAGRSHGRHYHHLAVPAVPHKEKSLTPQKSVAPSSLRACVAAPWVGKSHLFLREPPWAPVRSCSSISSNDVAPVEPSTTTSIAQDNFPEAVTSDGVSQDAEKASDTPPETGSMQSSGTSGGADTGAAGLGLAAPKQKRQSPGGARSKPRGLLDYTRIRGHTFQDSLPRVFQAIREADFVAFDLEYTGINAAPWQQMGEFDNKDTIYAKRKQSAANFVVLQVGLCPFRWEPGKGRFEVSPFNFLISPPVKNTPSFYCEAASLKFLLLNRIEMTESLNNGIPYLSDDGERSFKELHLDRKLREAASFRDHEYGDLSPEDTISIEKMVHQISEWHGAILAASTHEEAPSSRLRLPSLTLLQRRVIVEALRRLFPMVVPVTLNDAAAHTYEMGAGTEAKLRCTLEIVYAESEEEKTAQEARLRTEIEAQTQAYIDKNAGFKRVVEELAGGPAFLVGHNCMLDLMHILDKFGPGVPPTPPEFSAEVRSRFPALFDTKHMVFSDGMADGWGKFTSLYHLFKRTNDYDVPVKKAKGFENLPDLPSPAMRSGTAKHDGGLDAFAAGLLFARLAKRRGVEPGELRRLPELTQGRHSMWAPRQNAEDGSGRSGKGRDATEPLKQLAATANLLYAGMIHNTRASFSLLRNGHVRACRAEHDAMHRGKWAQHRPDVLLLWAFPDTLSDEQIRDAIAAEQGQAGHKIGRLDARAALVQFPSVELADAYWEAALRLQGQLGCGGRATLELEPGREVVAKVETYGTFAEVCQSGITAPTFTQAATWLGLDPAKPLLRREQAGVDPRSARRVKGKWASRDDPSETGGGEQVDKRSTPDTRRVWRRDTSGGTNDGLQLKSEVNLMVGRKKDRETTGVEEVRTRLRPEVQSEEESGTTRKEQDETQLQPDATSGQRKEKRKGLKEKQVATQSNPLYGVFSRTSS
ncbi:hypothetical protein KFL_004120110 [Klebsormidium nitens]|uniref:Uncharacterized protein n=1 Tax=Klebsormidium nitens TaxID=105231 RepID=A0A1Y1IB99_KLENI|nr:hypothetical protein KFL_004120110 [Klebsormidium nitens]|eukprot:GAQ88244.1 hypothetical protein KFL_004120110 [Klebsormidium nitens]